MNIPSITCLGGAGGVPGVRRPEPAPPADAGRAPPRRRPGQRGPQPGRIFEVYCLMKLILNH